MLLLLGIGCVNLKKVIVFPLPRYILFLKNLWPILNMEKLQILGSLKDLALMTFNCFPLRSSCLGCWCKRLVELLLNYLVYILYHQTWCYHKGSVAFLISFLGINRLFLRSGNSYPTTKAPQRPTQQFHMIPFREWTKIQGKINQVNIIFFCIPFPKAPELPQMQHVLSA
jgi:hypothetical protein